MDPAHMTALGRLVLAPALLCLAVVGLAACSTLVTPDSRQAVQHPYREGAPHTDASGRIRFTYDPTASFFPIGIYHALTGRHFGRDYDFAELKKAGFNLIHYWNGQDIAAVIGPAKEAGLQLIVPLPTIEDVRRFHNDPAVWGWYLDEEPSGHYSPDEQAAKLKAFAERRAAIHAIDPDRPVFSLDKPAVDNERRFNWMRWVDASDVAAHFNYPVLASEPLRSLSTVRGIPRSVSLAVEVSAEQKPVLLLVQAFSGPGKWRMPTPAQLRVMTYAGLIHGATGIVFFGYDSFVMRDGDVLGIASDPSADYGETPDYDNSKTPALKASESDLNGSRDIWRAVVALNDELHRLAPALLSPTATLRYTVSVKGPSFSHSPIRTLLKKRDGRFLLLAVNLDDVPLSARFSFPEEIRELRRFFDSTATPQYFAGGFEDDFPPLGVRLYSFEGAE
jgi:hypothetical protein